MSPRGRQGGAHRYRLRLTRSADAARKALRGESAERYAALEQALKAQACKAAGYRLLAADGSWSEYCCVHLDRRWRVVMTFDPEGTQIIQIGEHDGPAFYAELAKSYNVSRIGQRREQKPACCGEDGWPSVGPAKKARP